MVLSVFSARRIKVHSPRCSSPCCSAIEAPTMPSRPPGYVGFVCCGALDRALMEFSNIVLSGGVPLKVRPFFFAGLYAFSKSDGSVRPIKVSMTLRRMVAKVANVWSIRKSNHLLVPLQLGAGTKGGVEAIVHTTRSFLFSANAYQAIVKIDLTR